MKSNIWKEIKIYIIPLSSIIVGILALILFRLDLLSEKNIFSVILLLLILLVTTELLERKKRLSSIEEKLNDFENSLFSKTEIAKVKTIVKREDALEYIHSKSIACTISIDQASLDRKMNKTLSIERTKYNKLRNKLIKQDKIQYRYLALLHNDRRINIIKDIFQNKTIDNYFAGCLFKTETDIPFMNFIVFDKKSVIARYPFSYGKKAEYIVIESSDAAKLFLGYYERLWENSTKIKSIKDCDEVISRIKKATNNT